MIFQGWICTLFGIIPGLTNCILLSIFVFVPSDSEKEVDGKTKELD